MSHCLIDVLSEKCGTKTLEQDVEDCHCHYLPRFGQMIDAGLHLSLPLAEVAGEGALCIAVIP